MCALGTFAYAFASLGIGAPKHSAALASESTGRLQDGALWRIKVPERWNGTLLLYSHGYSAIVQVPALAPAGLEQWLLDRGYALAASSYARGGWAVAEAVPDQLGTLTTFIRRVGKPRETIAWGESMGGLVTIALAEQPNPQITGALSACGSISGSLAMMNLALDGAYAFKVLLAADSGIELVKVTDDRANAGLAEGALRVAMSTPTGRARVALAGVLAGLPAWRGVTPTGLEPSEADAQLSILAESFVRGVFLPRQDQARRAGGVYSWNTGVDYREQLRKSGRRRWVEYFYRRAGLDLDRDLAALNAAPRISAAREAVRYMGAHYEPTAAPHVPLLSYHTVGDGMTSPVLQGGYARAVMPDEASTEFRAVWVNAWGHCTFSKAEHIAALDALEHRLRSGLWAVTPVELKARAAALAGAEARFTDFSPPPLTRPCFRDGRGCSGHP